MHPTIRPSIHSFIMNAFHSLIHRPIHTIQPSMYASIHPFIHPFMHPSIHSCIHSCIHSSIHSFIHPSILPRCASELRASSERRGHSAKVSVNIVVGVVLQSSHSLWLCVGCGGSLRPTRTGRSTSSPPCQDAPPKYEPGGVECGCITAVLLNTLA